MDVMVLFKSVIGVFRYYWSIEFVVGNYTVTVGSALIFCAVVTIVMFFLKGIIE